MFVNFGACSACTEWRIGVNGGWPTSADRGSEGAPYLAVFARCGAFQFALRTFIFKTVQSFTRTGPHFPIITKTASTLAPGTSVTNEYQRPHFSRKTYEKWAPSVFFGDITPRIGREIWATRPTSPSVPGFSIRPRRLLRSVVICRLLFVTRW